MNRICLEDVKLLTSKLSQASPRHEIGCFLDVSHKMFPGFNSPWEHGFISAADKPTKYSFWNDYFEKFPTCETVKKLSDSNEIRSHTYLVFKRTVSENSLRRLR